MEKPPLTKRQIANLSVGLLGIQFGWGLQNANMSAISDQVTYRCHSCTIA